MFPHEEHLKKALEETGYKPIVLLQDLMRLYVDHVLLQESEHNFYRATAMNQILNEAIEKMAQLPHPE